MLVGCNPGREGRGDLYYDDDNEDDYEDKDHNDNDDDDDNKDEDHNANDDKDDDKDD